MLAVAYFMTIVDLTIVNVSLPTIGRDLHFSATSLQWVVTAYGLSFGGLMLLGGRTADLLGRRRIFMLGLAVFTVASLACGLARTDTVLIVVRGVQGAGAAIVLPAALSIVMNIFAEGADRNKALGIWGGLGAAGATFGLITGGLLTRYAGWEYIFYLNVPAGLAALALAPRVVPESRLATFGRRFDLAGAVTVTGALLLLVYAISTAPGHGWASGLTVGCLAAAAVLLGGSFYAFLFIGTLYLQQVQGYSALATGFAWLIASLTSVALAGLSQRLVTRRGPAPVLATGMALIAGGTLWASGAGVHGRFWADLAGPLLVAGAGTAFAFIPTSIAATRAGTLAAAGRAPAAALTGGFHWAFWFCAALAALAVPIGGLVVPRRRTASPGPAAGPASVPGLARTTN